MIAILEYNYSIKLYVITKISGLFIWGGELLNLEGYYYKWWK